MADVSFADKPTLTGDLVVLRPMGARDAPAFIATEMAPDVRRLTGTHRRFTDDELTEWYGSRGEHTDRLDLTVVDRASGEVVGGVHLMDLDQDNLDCSFRIALNTAREFNRGFGTEATRLILAHAFETVGVHRVQLEVFDFNLRARHVYEKIGFVHEGTLRQELRWDGEWIDTHVMAILADEWAVHRGRPVVG